MRTRKIGLLLLGVWALASIASYLLSAIEIVFDFAYFILPFSSFLVPLAVYFVAVPQRPADQTNSVAPSPWKRLGISAFAFFLVLSSYLLCAIVAGRFMELPWRTGKFGENSLSLGKTAALYYAGVAAVLLLASLILRMRSSSNFRICQLATGSAAMVGFSSLLYLILGASPLVDWRG